MQIALMHRGYTVGKRRISRIMKENGWLHERKRRPKGLTRELNPAKAYSKNSRIVIDNTGRIVEFCNKLLYSITNYDK